MDHSDDHIKNIAVHTSLSEEATFSVPSFSETFRTDDHHQVDLEQLRSFCLAPNGLVSSEWRKLGWCKLLGAHIEIWKAAAKFPPMDTRSNENNTTHLHHPSKDEIEYIKQVVASCEWESIGILKGDSVVIPEHNKSPTQGSSSPTTSKADRRVSFHLPELVFSTKRQKDRKTLRKILIHLKRTNPNFAITSATCCAVAMVVSIVQSSSISTLCVQQLVSFPWKYSREWPRSNNAWELDDRWQNLFRTLAPNLLEHFQTNGMDVLEGTIRYSWIPSWLSQNVPNKDLLARIWDVLIPSNPDAILYVCLSLLSHFETEFLSDTETSNIKSALLQLPTKLDSTEKVEAVLSKATEWMKLQLSKEETETIPSWATAKVAPDDCGIVEYASHLREAVTKGGESLISNNGSSADVDTKEGRAWFNLEGPDSLFAVALREKSSIRNEYKEAVASSSKSSWVLVLFILILAAAVILGLETDCSVILGTKSTLQSSNCFDQIFDLYRDDAMNRISHLQTRGLELRDGIRKSSNPYWDETMNRVSQLQTRALQMRDEIRKSSDPYWEHALHKVSQLQTKGLERQDETRKIVAEDEKQTAGVPSSSNDGTRMESSKISEAVMSPSENTNNGQVQEEIMREEAVDETLPTMDLEEPTLGQEYLDESESSDAKEEDTEAVDVETEGPEPPSQKHPGSVKDDLDNEEPTHNQENVDKLDDAGGNEDYIRPDDVELEVPEPVQNEQESVKDSDKQDGTSTQSDDPLERSRQAAEHLVKETLYQTESASKLAESIVSQFVEDAKASVRKAEEMTEHQGSPEMGPEHDGEVVIPEAIEDSNDIIQTEESKDGRETDGESDVNDADGDSPREKESCSFSNEEIEPKESYHAQETREESNTDETKMMDTEADGPEETYVVPSKQHTPPDQVPEAFNGDDHQTLSGAIEDPVNTGGDSDGAEEVSENEANEMLVGETHSQAPAEIEVAVTDTPEEDDNEHRSEATGNEESEDLQHARGGYPKPEQPHMEGYFAGKSLDDSTGEGSASNEKKVETEMETHDDTARPEPTEQNGDDGSGPTMLKMAHGLFSRYLGYLSSEPDGIIHLSTPFFGKDDVTAVFEQLMAASIDEGPMQNWDNKSKIRFNTWQSTILI